MAVILRHRKNLLFLTAVCLFLVSGGVRASLTPPFSQLVKGLGSEKVHLAGKVKLRRGSCFYVSLERVNQQPVGGSVRVLTPVPLKEGEWIDAIGELKSFSSWSSKPTLFLTQVRKRKEGFSWERFFAPWREKISQRLALVLPEEEAAFLKGVLWGDKSEISYKLVNACRTTGTAHLLAVSGLHVGIVFLISFSMGLFLRIPRYLSLAFSLALVFFYAALAAFSPSVTRAFLMLLLGSLGWYLGREKLLLSITAVTAWLLLLFDPAYLFDLSFKLSFSAVLGLAIFLPILDQIIYLSPPTLQKVTCATCAAQLGTFPLVLSNFGVVPLFSIPANLVAFFLLPLILWLGLTATALSLLSLPLSLVLFMFLHTILAFFLAFIRFLASLPLAYLQPSFFFSMGVYLFTLLALLALKGRIKLGAKQLLFGFLLFWTILLTFNNLRSFAPHPLRVYFLQVGQGDAAVVQTPKGRVILIDGGASPFLLQRHLSKIGVKNVDLVVLSHPHHDHLAGLFNLDEVYPGGTLATGVYPNSEEWRNFINSMDKLEVVTLKGEKEFLLDQVKLKFLFIDSFGDNLNNDLLVLKLSYKKVDFVFPGDAEEVAQEAMVDRELGEAEVLKLPHHGGTFLISPFFKMISPKIGIISVGKGNSYGHPAEAVLKSLVGVEVLRTDEDGTVLVETDGSQVQARQSPD
jgi:competence protein ComEC